ncbi:MAG: hypothetical protein HY738_21705, partial [Bacteroidia bacterium]|nr:hypothetical protein [Bacteroidia bacterium]
TQTNVSCNGGNNGAVNLTVIGAVPPYTYLWSNSATTQDINNLTAGTYTVTITDANSCTTTTSVTITQPTALTAFYTQTNVSCNGGNNGSINLTVSGGVSPYTYLWSNSATAQDINSLTAGIYTVTITDSNSCTKTTSVTITQPTALTASCTQTNVSCNGGNDGAINLTVFGGVSPYIYLWSNSATTQDINNLTAGTYTVTVTDANSCTTTTSVTITQPAVIVLTTNSVNASCGSSNGIASVSATGGTSPYTYLWSTGAVTNFIAGIPAGIYTVTVTDSQECNESVSISVNETGGPTLSATSIDVTCYSSCDGSATVTATGGTPPYTYLWSDGQITASADSLCAGSYNVTVTGNDGCSANTSVNISEPSVILINITSTDVSCSGLNDGTASVTASGGTAPYSYLWSTGGTSETETDLSAGTYYITVADAYGCYSTDSVIINEAVAITADITGTDVTCNGADDGSAVVSVSGGTPPYNYLWTTGGTSDTETGLSGSDYSVTVTDFNNCNGTASVTINEPLPITITSNIINASCGGSDGIATVSASGGTSPYSYLWSTGSATNFIAGVPAGVYSVTITDNNGCTNSVIITIGESGGPTVSVTSNDAACYGICDGSATVTATGGTPPYTYLWSTGDTATTANNLCAGSYNVTVTGNDGCEAFGIADINEPAEMNADVTSTDISCNGLNDGTAGVTVTGSVAPYNYLWSTGGTSDTETELAAGAYDVIISDADGCFTSASVTINEPSALSSVISSSNVSCNGGNDGSISLSVSGGTPPYIQQWSAGPSFDPFTDPIPAGVYSVTITDVNGCTATNSVTVTEPSAITITTNAINASCGNSDGIATAATSGGTSPYTYLWSNGSTTNFIAGVPAGIYTITVTDSNGCTESANVAINETGAPAASATSADATCYSICDGSATVTATGGTQPYTYLWSTGDTAVSINNLCAGSYYVTVTGNNGCNAYSAVTINEPELLTITVNVTNASSITATDGSATAVVTGGTAPYTYI